MVNTITKKGEGETKEQKRKRTTLGGGGTPGKKPLSAKDPAREELRQKQLRTDPKFAADVKGKARDLEVKNKAQMNVDIDKKEKEIQTTAVMESPTTADMGNEAIESGGLTKVREEGKETIDTETIRFTDESGFEREIQMPAGTSDKIAASNARREGRVPFSELPAYQQFLAGAIVTGVSPATLTKTGKALNILGAPLTKFMTTQLGKYVAGVTTFSGIMTWLASDNIIGTMSIYTRDLAEDVTFGKISKEEALEKIDEGDNFVEQGRAFIRTATMINPLLWPFRKIILANADAAQLAIEENKARINRA